MMCLLGRLSSYFLLSFSLLLFGMWAQTITAQSAPSSQNAWTGQVECQLNMQSGGYAHQETQTWTLTGGAPTLQGATQIYPANWTTDGQGNMQQPQGAQILAGRWNSKVPGMAAPIAIVVRASDNRLVIRSYHGQIVVHGGVTGLRQFGAAQSTITTAAYEWPFPTIEGAPASTSVSGSGTELISGSIVPMQSPTNNGTATCHWQFTKGDNNAPQPITASTPVAIVPRKTAGTTVTIPGNVGQLRQPTHDLSPNPVITGPLQNKADYSVPVASAGPAVKAAPEQTGPPAYDTVNSTPASFQASLRGLSYQRAEGGIDYEWQWCEVTGCNTWTQGGDTVELTGTFQAGDQLHVIVGRTGPDTTLYNNPKWCDDETLQCGWATSFTGSGTAMPSPTTTPTLENPIPAWIYVKRGTQHSNLIPVTYGPPLQKILQGPTLPTLAPSSTTAGFGADLYWHGSVTGDGTEVQHRGGFFGGAKGDDVWFDGILRKGWYIVAVDVTCNWGSPCEADGYGLGGAAMPASPVVPGSTNPRITMHWWVNANGFSTYTIHHIVLIGPQGTAPFLINGQ